MEQRAIFPTPNCNPCYSLDEFNYPAPPQWYLRAVSGYNKRMGLRGRGRGGVAWRSGPEEPHRMGVVPDNHGYQQYAPPTTYPRPIPLFDEQSINETPPPTLNAGVYPTSDSIPFIRPYTNNIGPPPMNIGTFPGMPLPMGVTMTTGHVSMTPPMMPPQAPPTNVNSDMIQKLNTTVLPVAPPPTNTLFETSLFDSFPQTQVTSTDNPIKNQLTMDVSNQSMEDTNDLVIAKQDDEEESNSYEDVSPSPVVIPDTDAINSDRCSFTVSTLSIKSLGRKRRQSVLGHSKRGGVNRQRLPKSLVVSVELKKIHLPGGEEGTDEELDYDDYLDQLNNEEDQEEGEPPLLPPSDPTEGFWIDTNPDSRNNPLENDFPTLEGERNAPQSSLRSLIGIDSSVDKSVLAEEGSDQVCSYRIQLFVTLLH